MTLGEGRLMVKVNELSRYGESMKRTPELTRQREHGGGLSNDDLIPEIGIYTQ